MLATKTKDLTRPILTREQVADRWQCSLPTVDVRVKNGVLRQCSKLPPGRFRYEDVLAAEGVEFNPLQPSERLRLERELADAKRQVASLRSILNAIAAQAIKFIGEGGETT